MKSVFKLEELNGVAYAEALKKTRKELREAFHFNTRNASASLLEELANDYFFRFDANGDFI